MGRFPSLDFERALRLAALGHRGQVRKGSGVPYVEHPFGVALILDRAGFDESIVIAGLLHDLVEDTEVTLEQIRDEFGEGIASMVAHCSETKLDASGVKRPWAERKRDHVAALAGGPAGARAVTLADKLHNLISIRLDLDQGRPVWSSFNADRASVMAYYRAMIEACGADDPRITELADECLALLAEVAGFEGGNRQSGPGMP